MGFQIASGNSGELWCSYQLAGRLGAWTLTVADTLTDKSSVRARLDWQNDYWITQRPLELRLDVGRGQWRWRDAGLALEGERAVIIVRGKPNV